MNAVLRTLTVLAVAWASVPPAAAQQRYPSPDDDPAEYRGRDEVREAYRRGYERGYDRGFRKGLEEGERRAPPVAAPAPPAAPRLGPIRVSGAFYGTSAKRCDATRYVRRQADGRRAHSFNVSNDMCGDPSHGDRKTLEVNYWCGEVARSASAREHQAIYLNCN